MTTLTNGTVTVTLPDDLVWADEFAWQPVEQTVQRSLTGALIVQAQARTGGRPITLAAESDSVGWVDRATVEALEALASVPAPSLTLTLRGVAHAVLFRHQDGAIEARPVVGYSDVQSTDPYHLTVRLMKV